MANVTNSSSDAAYVSFISVMCSETNKSRSFSFSHADNPRKCWRPAAVVICVAEPLSSARSLRRSYNNVSRLLHLKKKVFSDSRTFSLVKLKASQCLNIKSLGSVFASFSVNWLSQWVISTNFIALQVYYFTFCRIFSFCSVFLELCTLNKGTHSNKTFHFHDKATRPELMYWYFK